MIVRIGCGTLKTILRLENLTKSFGEKCVVNGVSIDVEEGEFLTLLGPSGCGKTTILRCISGLEEVTSGKIYIDDEDVTDLTTMERPVNTIFQSYALFSHMTVFDNVAYGLKMKKLKKEEIKKRVEEMLKMVRLDGYEDRFPGDLSGGEQQRVAIARALVNKPKVLLLDEPLSALDRKLQKSMEVKLKRLQKKMKTTFIYVTHNQDEALTMSDRIVIMNDSKFEQIGTPYNIYKEPKTLFVANFIGESNIFDVTLKEAKKGYVLLYLNEDFHVTIPDRGYLTPGKYKMIIRPEDFFIKLEDTDATFHVKYKESIYDGGYTKIYADYYDMQIVFNIKSTHKEFEAGADIDLGVSPKGMILIREDKDEGK